MDGKYFRGKSSYKKVCSKELGELYRFLQNFRIGEENNFYWYWNVFFLAEINFDFCNVVKLT